MGRDEGCVLVIHYVNFVELCEQIVWVVYYGTPVECSAGSSGPGSIFVC
jgi:hypothetical protein